MYVKIGLHVLTYTAGSLPICAQILPDPADLRSDPAGSRRSAPDLRPDPAGSRRSAPDLRPDPAGSLPICGRISADLRPDPAGSLPICGLILPDLGDLRSDLADLRSDLAGSRRSALRSCRSALRSCRSWRSERAQLYHSAKILGKFAAFAISCAKNQRQILPICYIVPAKMPPRRCPYGQTPTLPIFGFSGFLGDRLDFWDFRDFPPVAISANPLALMSIPAPFH